MNNITDIKSKTKIVLGHPLSGALYAYFDKQLNKGQAIKASKNHTYYKTLYGDHFESYIDVAITLSLIYETVITAPADNAVPDYGKYEVNGEYYNPDFGLYFTWQDNVSYRDVLDEKITNTLADRQISTLLWDIPPDSRTQIIRDIYNELSLANKFNATLFSLGKRQQLAKRITQIENETETEFVEANQIELVSTYLDISSLMFQPMDIQAFYYLKTEKDLREYSSSFAKIIEGFTSDSTEIKRQLLMLIKEAISKDKINSNISGIFEGTSEVLNYLGYVPIIGVAAGIASIGTNLASKGFEKYNEKHKWYEFASHIERFKSLEKIHRSLVDI